MPRRDEPEPRIRRRSRGPAPLSPDHYFARSRQPLASLVFLLPLIIAYELGAFLYLGPSVGRDVTARLYLMEFLQFFGAAADYLIGPLVIAVLLCVHLAKRDRWRFEPRLYGAMGIESVALAIPALMFSLLVGTQHAAQAVSGDAGAALPYSADLVISVGAGIYEELVFRLILIAAVHALVVDVLGSNATWGALIAVFASATLFGLYHFGGGPGGRVFTWPLFIYFSLLGFYFAILYIVRGFGIVVAVHALFDIMVVSLQHEVIPLR